MRKPMFLLASMSLESEWMTFRISDPKRIMSLAYANNSFYANYFHSSVFIRFS